jgi:hypothetical protein
MPGRILTGRMVFLMVLPAVLFVLSLLPFPYSVIDVVRILTGQDGTADDGVKFCVPSIELETV